MLGAVDFNDLIHLAWKCLRDPDLVRQLAHRWLAISRMKPRTRANNSELNPPDPGRANRQLGACGGQQAIYQSFTTADPRLLKDSLPERTYSPSTCLSQDWSCQEIIDLANRLNGWVSKAKPPNQTVRDALTKPFIIPTKPGDPQQNPPCNSDAVEFITQPFSSRSRARFHSPTDKNLAQRPPQDTVAVLALVNARKQNC